MDFHALPRRDLQALAKRNGVRANLSNAAIVDALAALPAVSSWSLNHRLATDLGRRGLI